MIAPFWDDVLIPAEVYYRFAADPSLLEEVGGNISDAFNTSFTPTQLFIATWNRVAAINNLFEPTNEVSKIFLTFVDCHT